MAFWEEGQNLFETNLNKFNFTNFLSCSEIVSTKMAV